MVTTISVIPVLFITLSPTEVYLLLSAALKGTSGLLHTLPLTLH